MANPDSPKKKYINDYKGLNSRLDEIQAAILRVKLRRLDEDTIKRRTIANYYLGHIDNPTIVLPEIDQTYGATQVNSTHVWHLFVIRCMREQLKRVYIYNALRA